MPLPPAHLASSLEIAVLAADGLQAVGEGPGSKAGDSNNWLTISDAHQSVIGNVRRIREHPLLHSRIPIYGFIVQVAIGSLIEIEAASALGRAAR